MVNTMGYTIHGHRLSTLSGRCDDMGKYRSYAHAPKYRRAAEKSQTIILSLVSSENAQFSDNGRLTVIHSPPVR